MLCTNTQVSHPVPIAGETPAHQLADLAQPHKILQNQNIFRLGFAEVTPSWK